MIGDGEVTPFDDIHANKNFIMFYGETANLQIVKEAAIREGKSNLIDLGFLLASYSANRFTSDRCKAKCFGKFRGYNRLF